MCQITNNSVCLSFQEYVGKAGDVLENVFFVVSGLVEARMMKPGKQVGFALARCEGIKPRLAFLSDDMGLLWTSSPPSCCSYFFV